MNVSKKPESQFNIYDWWKKAAFDNFANFDGRARRSEYWYFTLFNVLVTIAFVFVAVILVGVSGAPEEPPAIFYMLMLPFGLFYLILLIPSIAVSVRRLHDTDRSGWWYLLNVIPIVNYVGSIVLLVFYCTEGTRGANQYGKDPKNQENELMW
ncbi:DUF805 domain-containing protein [Marinirhabdus gelatinilytica]|uniref:Uncharacterized membrane protein YhaH (DUF805 family) n=1 Tax=Marinirhabdus gelatinilytica TaxID=1703343 RepID=A0A370Q7K7_9FLAO|nr:DUF805 domain-containing protein [Marinirhabdus gelatinilytica]RDK84326.1 uncharacterized membrane protein YhaH (DUF805 family) [Marinirhabdus gelatinilytica]